MAKSSYLDNLINNSLPANLYRYRYLSELWEMNSTNAYISYRNGFVNGLSDDVEISVTGSDYLNNIATNQTVINMSNPKLATITLDKEYLPRVRQRRAINNNLQNKLTMDIKVPADYLPASITSVKGGSSHTIPILFPKTFSRSISANFAKENPIGSSTPIVAFSYTDAEELPFEFDALADYLPNGYSSLKEYVDDILSILQPKRSSSVIYEPTVIVEFADIRFKGICQNINISYDNVYNYRSFVHATISCSFTKLNS